MIKNSSLLVLIVMTLGCTQINTNEFNCRNLTDNYWETISGYKPEKIMEFISSLNKVLQESPRCKNAYALRGELFFSLEEYDKAKTDFLSLSMIDTNNVYAYFELGLIYELKMSFDSAVLFYEKAISKKMQGTFVMDKNNDVEKLVGKRGFDVKFVSLKLRKGIANYYKGNLKAAFTDLNYCIEKGYLLKESYLYRGLIYKYMNKIKEACEDFKQAKINGNTDINVDIQKHCK